jgi:hypothetical protein
VYRQQFPDLPRRGLEQSKVSLHAIPHQPPPLHHKQVAAIQQIMHLSATRPCPLAAHRHPMPPPPVSP